MSKTIEKEEVVKKSNQPQSEVDINNFKFKSDWKDWSTILKLITIYEKLIFQTTMSKKQMYSILYDSSIEFDDFFEISDDEFKVLLENQRIEVMELRRNLFNQHPIFNKEVNKIKNQK